MAACNRLRRVKDGTRQARRETRWTSEGGSRPTGWARSKWTWPPGNACLRGRPSPPPRGARQKVETSLCWTPTPETRRRQPASVGSRWPAAATSPPSFHLRPAISLSSCQSRPPAASQKSPDDHVAAHPSRRNPHARPARLISVALVCLQAGVRGDVIPRATLLLQHPPRPPKPASRLLVHYSHFHARHASHPVDQHAAALAGVGSSSSARHARR